MNPPDPNLLKQAAAWFADTVPGQTFSHAVICGSGWGDVVQDLDVLKTIPFQDIPGLGVPGVQGHRGEVVITANTLIFKGRRHLYEGEGWTPIAVPIYLCLKAGVKNMLLTNSAGAVHPDFKVGDLMRITDHINLLGDNPLVGPHCEEWGPRFPDLSEVYSRDRLIHAAERAGVSLHSGVYAATRGPIYETPAEVRAWKTLGADAVGMSTVPEAILAHAAGMQVSAISCLTNFAAGISPAPLSHEEVTESTRQAMPRMRALVREWISNGVSYEKPL
jgi:purine-nucleoside phosphorylase